MPNRKNAKPCMVIFNGRNISVAAPIKVSSIAEGVRLAKNSGWFAYTIVTEQDRRIVRRGFCG